MQALIPRAKPEGIVAKFTRKEARTNLEINVMCAKFSGSRPFLGDHTHFGAIVYYHAH
jgi:hypothetical protein